MPSDTALTIDELAAAVGAPSRTVRYWQSLGLLPAPRREGRVARYGDRHLRRARLVALLSARGIRLEAMGGLVDLLETGGDSLREWLGLRWEELIEIERPSNDDPRSRVPADELLARLGGRPEMLRGLARMHVVRPADDGAWVVPSGGLLDLALRIDRLGVDVETSVGAEAILRHHLRAMAEEIVAWFEACLPPAESTRAGWARLGALRPIGADAVRLLFWQELTRAFRRRALRPPVAGQGFVLPGWFRWVLGRRFQLGNPLQPAAADSSRAGAGAGRGATARTVPEHRQDPRIQPSGAPARPGTAAVDDPGPGRVQPEGRSGEPPDRPRPGAKAEPASPDGPTAPG